MSDSKGADARDADEGSGEEVDTFDRKLEGFIHEYIADARPTDGPAPGA
ncbi:hypothetical protein [Herbiconiux sp.]|nr:hypothetical protein [Herbiconiux sp.]